MISDKRETSVGVNVTTLVLNDTDKRDPPPEIDRAKQPVALGKHLGENREISTLRPSSIVIGRR